MTYTRYGAGMGRGISVYNIPGGKYKGNGTFWRLKHKWDRY
jgi:hypothetical protein